MSYVAEPTLSWLLLLKLSVIVGAVLLSITRGIKGLLGPPTAACNCKGPSRGPSRRREAKHSTSREQTGRALEAGGGQLGQRVPQARLGGDVALERRTAQLEQHAWHVRPHRRRHRLVQQQGDFPEDVPLAQHRQWNLLAVLADVVGRATTAQQQIEGVPPLP